MLLNSKYESILSNIIQTAQLTQNKQKTAPHFSHSYIIRSARLTQNKQKTAPHYRHSNIIKSARLTQRNRRQHHISVTVI